MTAVIALLSLANGRSAWVHCGFMLMILGFSILVQTVAAWKKGEGLLELPLFHFLRSRSLELYLWQYPVIFIFNRLLADVLLSKVLDMAVTVLFATMSSRLLERVNTAPKLLFEYRTRRMHVKVQLAQTEYKLGEQRMKRRRKNKNTSEMIRGIADFSMASIMVREMVTIFAFHSENPEKAGIRTFLRAEKKDLEEEPEEQKTEPQLFEALLAQMREHHLPEGYAQMVSDAL